MATFAVITIGVVLVNFAEITCAPAITWIFALAVLTHIGSPSKNRTPVYCLQDSCSTTELTGHGLNMGRSRSLHTASAYGALPLPLWSTTYSVTSMRKDLNLRSLVYQTSALTN